MKILGFFTKNGVFLLATSVCFFFIAFTIFNKIQVMNITMERLILSKSARASDEIIRLTSYRTNTLSALVLQSEDVSENIDKIATAITDDPSVMRVAIAPEGIVKYVYPLEGNESILGTDMLNNGVGTYEAIMAKDLEDTVLGGPFDVLDG